jgi:O-6-methylguanine DNA methyltransferase
LEDNMLPFLALHAIAAPRGEGLRPELLKRFRHIAGNPEFDFPSTKRGQTASSARRPDSSALGFIEGPEKGLDQAIDVRGTPFRQRVWGALLGIPAGSMVTYAALAARIGEPKSARPVANAYADIADALAIPRHRVLSSNGTLSGHRWCEERKRALIENLPRSMPNAADAAAVE